MIKIHMKSAQNGCCVYWFGPGSYAGAVRGGTFVVLPCLGENDARRAGAEYLGTIYDIQSLIKTLHGRGYRTIAVERV
jgi:hypothetical protein